MKKTIKFGRYFFNSKQEMDEIEWIVLDETEGKKLLISKNCVETMQYDYEENKIKNPNWENGILRMWLNNYFLNLCFIIREKERLEPITIITPDGQELSDKIILMSAEEVERYFPEEKVRRSKPTSWAKKRKNPTWDDVLYTENGYCSWFLRDPSEVFDGNYTAVDCNGKINLIGGDFRLGGRKGLRPVILLREE